MKKLLSVCLALLLLFSSMALQPISPLAAQAAEPKNQAKVVGTFAGGLGFNYVTYEYNGKRYRSDEVGPGFNNTIWNMLNSEDRRKVVRNYAFSPRTRVVQFGEHGSRIITDWINQETGWTEAGEIWKQRIGNRDYPELTSFYAVSTEDLPVGDTTLKNVKYELQGLPIAVKQNRDYESARQLLAEIEQEYATGKDFCNRLVDMKAKEVGATFKAGAKILINDVILSNLMLPNISPGTMFYDVIYEFGGFLKDRLTELHNKVRGEPDPMEILTIMQEIVEGMEQMDYALKADVTNKLPQLASLMVTLREQRQQANEEYTVRTKEAWNNTEKAAEDTFAWSSQQEDYDHLLLDFGDGQDEIKKKQEEAKVKAQALKAEYESLVNHITSRKSSIYNRLDFNDGFILTKHPTYKEKWNDSGLYTSDEIPEPAYTSLHLPLSPYHFFWQEDYDGSKRIIESEGNRIIADYNQSINRMENYIQDVEDLLSDPSLQGDLESITGKYNGLRYVYRDFGWDLQGYLFEDIHYDHILPNLKNMLKTEGGLDDYGWLEMTRQEKDEAELNLNNFLKECTIFESRIEKTAADYSTLSANCQNSAAHMVDAYNLLNKMYQENPYFKFIEEAGLPKPRVDRDYINGLINAAANEGKEIDAIRQEIVNDLKDFLAQETHYLNQVDAGLEYFKYDTALLDHLMGELGIKNSPGGAANLSKLIGKKVITVDDYLLQNETVEKLYYGPGNPNATDLPQTIETLQGSSGSYYLSMLLSDIIELDSQRLRELSDSEFDAVYDQYQDQLREARNIYQGMTTEQMNNIWDANGRGSQILEDLKTERDQDPGTGNNGETPDNPPPGDWYQWGIKDNEPQGRDWTILFNMPIDHNTIDHHNISVYNALNKPVPVTVKPGPSDDTVLVLPPAGNYLPGEKYTLYINDVKSASGHPLGKAIKMEFHIDN